MGRGSAYRWPHFMLYDDDHFQISFDDGDGGSTPNEFDEEMFRDFQRDIAKAFNATVMADNDRDRYIPDAREARYFAETDRLKIGIDTGGGLPCIFVTPKWEIDEATDEEKDYDISVEVSKAFNDLIDTYGDGFFLAPTSAWTSVPLSRYG